MIYLYFNKKTPRRASLLKNVSVLQCPHTEGELCEIKNKNYLRIERFLKNNPTYRTIDKFTTYEDKWPFNTISIKSGIRGNLYQPQWHVGDITNKNSLEIARNICVGLINKNITGITREASIKTRKNGFIEIESRFTFTSMIEVAYWQLLDALEGGEFRECEQCGKPFIMTDKRQKFCPKLQFENESKCAVLFRQQKRRKQMKPSSNK